MIFDDEKTKINKKIDKYINEVHNPDSNLVQGEIGLASISDQVDHLNEKKVQVEEKQEQEKKEQLQKDIDYLNKKDDKKQENDEKEGLKTIDKKTGKEIVLIFEFVEKDNKANTIFSEGLQVYLIEKKPQKLVLEDLLEATFDKIKKDIAINNPELSAEELGNKARVANVDLWFDLLNNKDFVKNLDSSTAALDQTIRSSKCIESESKTIDEITRINLQNLRQEQRLEMIRDQNDFKIVLEMLDVDYKQDIKLLKMEIENSLNKVDKELADEKSSLKDELVNIVEDIKDFLSGKSDGLSYSLSPKKMEIPSTTISAKEFSRIFGKDNSRELD